MLAARPFDLDIGHRSGAEALALGTLVLNMSR